MILFELIEQKATTESSQLQLVFNDSKYERTVGFVLVFLLTLSSNALHADAATFVTNNDRFVVSGKDTVPNKSISLARTQYVDSIDKSNSAIIIADRAEDIQKATVCKSDSSIHLTSNIKLDHRIFGYDKPSTSSRKMILISVFTSDVKGNPFNCPFEAYYQTMDLKQLQIKYVSINGHFGEAVLIKGGLVQANVFIERKWIYFEK